MTLTRQARPGQSLSAAADALPVAFARLRRAKAWKSAVRGGFFVVEFGGEGGRHVHIHAVVDADWIQQADLHRAWNRSLSARGSADPHPVGGARVERARDGTAVVRYVLKAQAADDLNDEDLSEVVLWMHGRRLMQTFGSLHGKVIADAAPQSTNGAPSRRCSWDRGGINAATGEWVPPGSVAWQVSELAHRVGAGLAGGRARPRVGVAPRLPDDAQWASSDSAQSVDPSPPRPRP